MRVKELKVGQRIIDKELGVGVVTRAIPGVSGRACLYRIQFQKPSLIRNWNLINGATEKDMVLTQLLFYSELNLIDTNERNIPIVAPFESVFVKLYSLESDGATHIQVKRITQLLGKHRRSHRMLTMDYDIKPDKSIEVHFASSRAKTLGRYLVNTEGKVDSI